MASLKALKSDIAPQNLPAMDTFHVYNNSDSASNGGKCCLFTVPDGVTNVSFEVWGGAGGGAGARCCQYPTYGSSGGMYVTRTITTSPGCTYTICAGGTTGNSTVCLGCTGSTSYVSGSGISTTCAVGGCGGRVGCFVQDQNIPCCRSCPCWRGGSGDFCQPSVRPNIKGEGCMNHNRPLYSGPYKLGTFNSERTPCIYTWCACGCCYGACHFPSGGGMNSKAYGGGCKRGEQGGAGIVRISYT